MSTTVSYKGQTLTTVSNDTKTLLTEGKYLEDDLTLTDVTQGGSTLITKNISANGTYNASSDSADGYSQVTVAVPASAVDSGTKSITANGTHDVVGYASANVNVPNSYSQSDEGKVVSSGALVAQSSQNIDTNGTYDTTLKNEVVVNVSGGGSTIQEATGTFTGDDTDVAKFACSFKPDIVYIVRINAVSLSTRVFAGFLGSVFGEDKGYVLYQNNANSTDISLYAGNMTSEKFKYSNGIVSVETMSSRPVSSSCEYKYYAVKFTT